MTEKTKFQSPSVRPRGGHEAISDVQMGTVISSPPHLRVFSVPGLERVERGVTR